jgi:hypothetical protein
MSIEAICNQALDTIGYKRHIGSIWDGTPAARVLLDAWGDTRDALISGLRPDWSTWDDELLAIKVAPSYYDEQNPWTPAYPDLPWRYEYGLPDLCLVPLALKSRPTYLTIYRPRPMRFRVKAKDTYTLLGDDPAPILTCVHSVRDTELWPEDFRGVMVAALSKRVAPLVGAKEVKNADERR